MMLNQCLLVGYFGGPNLGDELIALTGAHLLTKKGASVVLTVGKMEPSRKSIGDQYKLIKGGYPGHINLREILKVVSELDKSGCVVYPGGGILQDVHSMNLLNHCVLFALYACLRNKPFFFIGIGVGPLNSKLARKITSFLIRNASSISVRDKASHDLATKLLAENKQNIALGVDSAWAFDSSAFKKLGVNKRVLLAIRSWPGVTEDWVKEIVTMLSSSGYTPAFLVCEINNDERFYNKINQKLPHPIELLSYTHTTDAIHEIVNCSALISMRLHPLIIAAERQVPIVAIPYDDKISELMIGLQLDQNIVEIGCATSAIKSILEKEKMPDKSTLHESRETALSMFDNVAKTSNALKVYSLTEKIAALHLLSIIAILKFLNVIKYRISNK